MKRSFLVLSLLSSLHMAVIHHFGDAIVLAKTSAKSVKESRRKHDRRSSERHRHGTEVSPSNDNDNLDW